MQERIGPAISASAPLRFFFLFVLFVLFVVKKPGLKENRFMEIIPVIDLMNGVVVHALRGLRDRYRPVSTPLCRDPEPASVLRALLGLGAFRTVYVADLDAIRGTADHFRLLDRLRRSFPEIRFWLDAGRAGLEYRADGVRPVIGTETGISRGELARIRADRPDLILSLDFAGRHLLGDPAIRASAEDWTDDVIVMCLNRVGAETGPALGAARRVRQDARGKRIYIGGGIRHAADLQALAREKLAGALVATALHNGTIERSAIFPSPHYS